jgi:hypothetical protein
LLESYGISGLIKKIIQIPFVSTVQPWFWIVLALN